MKTSAFLAFLFSFTIGVAQNTGSIIGYVFDDMGEPLYGANVFVNTPSGLQGTISDDNGIYTIKPLVPGIYDLNMSYVGFQKVKIIGVNVIGGRQTFIEDKNMKIDIGKVVDIYTYTHKLVDPENPSMTIMDAKTIEKLPQNKQITAILTNMSSDISKDEKTGEIHIRGARAGSMVYFIDGMRTETPNGGIPGAAIGSMKVYTGGIPAKYGDCTGGVIAVETKSFFDIWKSK